MKVSIETGPLASALEVAGRAVGKESPVDAAKTVLLQAEGKRITFSSTDLTVSVRTSIAAAVEREGALAVPAQEFGSLARTLSGQALLAMAPNDWMDISCGATNGRLPALAPDLFPALPDPPEQPECTVPAPTLIALLKRAIVAVGRSNKAETQMNLTCLRVAVGQGSVSVVSTDGHRLLHAKATTPADHEERVFVMPIRMAQLLLSLEERVGKGDLSLAKDDSHLFLLGVDLVLTCRHPSNPGYFPVVDRAMAIPANYSEASASVTDLKAALRRMAIVANTAHVAIDISAKELLLRSESVDKGLMKEGVKTLDLTGGPGKVGFSIPYLADFLGTLASDAVTFSFSPDSAELYHVHLWPKDGKDEHHYVLAQMRP